MVYDENKLYELLPAVYRQKDNTQSLKALIQVIANHVNILEGDIEGLYNNLFIETCQEWVVPYIADLLGAKIIHSGIGGTALNLRPYVANTIRYRRRKGTLSVLQDMGYDVTSWPCKGVEFFKNLVTTQNLNHLRMKNPGCINLRDSESLELIGTSFDIVDHIIDVRLIKYGKGFYNIPNVGIFLWRLQSYKVIDSPAFSYGDGRRYSFSQLGNDIPLFNPVNTDVFETSNGDSTTCTVQEDDLPLPLRRKKLESYRTSTTDPMALQKRFVIKKDRDMIKNDNITICDLSNWFSNTPYSGEVLIDPILGRIFFGDDTSDDKIKVTYWYGSVADIGGGNYERDDSILPTCDITICISKLNNNFPPNCIQAVSIPDAIIKWKNGGQNKAIFEIIDSEIYTEDIDLNLDETKTLVIKSAPNTRPIIQPSSFNLTGDSQSELCLAGLLISNSGIFIKNGDLKQLTLSHCTLVPGGMLHQDGTYSDPAFKSISIESGNNNLCISVQKSICGGIQANSSLSSLDISDSVIDCPNDVALSCYGLDIENATVFGSVSVEFLNNASNTIFNSKVLVNRCQQGCVRFCYIPESSKTPLRYKCQPPENSSLHPSTHEKIIPAFSSTSYGTPNYAQLRNDISKKISEGADNECEMGTFNFLQEASRLKNLKSGIEEYSRFANEIGTFLVT